MTTPNFDFLDQKTSTPSPTATIGGGVDLSFLDKPVEEQDLISTATNAIKNVHTILSAFVTANPELRQTLPVLGLTNPADLNEAEMAKLGGQFAQAAETGSPALQQSINDIRNMFGKFGEDPSAAINGAIEAAKKTGIGGIVKGIPMGILSMMTAPIEASTGLGVDRAELYAMTPEERAHKIKETAGNIVGLAAGAGVGKAVGAGFGLSAEAAVAGAVEDAGTAALKGVTRSLRAGALARKLVAGTVEGSAFGTTQAAIASANQPDQLTNMIVNGILFAPIGGALHMLTGADPLVKNVDISVKGVDAKPIIKDVGVMGRANDILKLRQLEMGEQLSLQDVTKWVESFATADDLDQAIVSGKFLGTKDVVVLDGINISQGRISDLYTLLNPGIKDWAQKRAEYNDKLAELVNAREKAYNKYSTSWTTEDFDAASVDTARKEYENAASNVEKFKGENADLVYGLPPKDNFKVVQTVPFAKEDATRLANLQAERDQVNKDYEGAQAAYDVAGTKLATEAERDTYSRLGRQADQLFNRRQRLQREIDQLFVHQNMPQRTLIIGKDSGINADALDHFEYTGYLPDEIVSYEGKDYKVRDTKETLGSFTGPVLVDPTTGRTITVPDLKRIRVKSTGIASSKYVTFESNNSLKGRYLAEFKASGSSYFTSSFEEQNRAAISQAESGKPITLIGFRQERGPNITTAGRFYSAFATGTAGYSPAKYKLAYVKDPGFTSTDINGNPTETLPAKTIVSKIRKTDADLNTPAGKRQSLVLHKLEFEKPLVVSYGDQSYLGGHYGLVKGAGKGFLPFPITEAETRMIQNAYKLTSKSTSSHIDPYVMVDKVIAKVLKDHGYDGIIYQDGSQVVDLRGKVALDQATKVTDTGLITGTASTETFRQKVYDDFKSEILDEARNVHAQIPKGANKELIGFDDAPPSDIASVRPTRPFNELIDDYIKRKGIDPTTRDFVVADFESRLHNELLQDIDPVDKQALAKVARDAEKLRETEAQFKNTERLLNIDKLRKSAESNGYYLDHEEGQTFVLRDAESDVILHKATKLSDMQSFIDATGQRQGIELDGGGSNGLPPRMFGTLQPQGDGPLRPNEVPFIHSPDGKMGNITSAFNSIADFLTPNREILIGIDNKYGTKLFENIYDKTQVARARANAAIAPWYKKLQAIEAIDKRMSKGEREIVGGHLETMSADEIRASGGGGGRPLNDAEKIIADELVKVNGDINKAFKYNRQLASELEGISDQAEIANATDKVRAAFAMTPEDLRTAGILNTMAKQKVASIGPTVRLAKTIMNGGGMTKAEYAAHHKMTPQQLAMSNQLTSLFKELAPQFGIDESNMLQNYMTHARLYAKGDISGTLNFFDIKGQNKEFYAKMVRTEEIDAYETDPIRAAQRYIKAGFDAKLFDGARAEAEKSLRTELLKVPDEAQKQVKHVVDRYMNDLQGSPGPAAKFTQNTVDRMLDGLGIDVSIDVRKNIVNTIAATGEAAAQGFRLVAGIRDFYTGVSLYYARFGVLRTGRMLKMGLTGLESLSRQSLSEAGVIPTLSQVAFDTPTEFTSTVLGRSTGMVGGILRKTGEVGLKLSGQKDVYALLHAGSYLDSWSLAGETLTKMNRGELTKAQAYKKLAIESYHLPVAQAFDNLVTAGKFDEAAQFLGRVTGQEQVGVFGLGNNPGGWNTNVGRIAGQFGSWSMWYRAHMMQMASRGSYGYRAASLSRLAATQAVLVGVGAATGLRLGSWYTPPGLMFAGGPIIQALQTVNDAVSGYGPEQKLAKGRLSKFLPYDGEKFNIGQIYIPGSYFANDLARAFQAAQAGQSVPAVAAQALGFRMQNPQ